MWKKYIKKNLIGISLALVLLILLMSKTNQVDYEVIDYDFYLTKDAFYAFVIEGRGVKKHNDLNDRDYLCGKRILVFKKEIDAASPT